MNPQDTINKIYSILYCNYEDPAEQIIKEAETLKAIGEALKGLSLREAKGVMMAVKSLCDIRD